MRFRIYHTNDMHCSYAFMKKAYVYLLENRREEDLYFDSGDLTDLKDLIVQADMGVSLSKLFSCLRPDGMAVGNGEIDLGRSGVEAFAKNVKLIASNLSRNDRSDIDGVLRSDIVVRGNHRFLVLGVSPYYRSDMTCNNYNVFSMMNDLMVEEPIEKLKEEIERNRGLFDHIILVSHSGVTVEKEFRKHIPEIDIILSGHSHEVYNDHLFTQSGKSEYLGMIEIEVDDSGIHELANVQIDIEDRENEAFERLLDEKSEYADRVLSEEMEMVEELEHDCFKESRLVSFICDAMLKEYGGDLAVMHNGIAEGSLLYPVSRKSLVSLFPSKLNPTGFPVSGRNLLEAIRMSFDEEYIHRSGKGPGFRGSVLGALSFSHNVSISFDDGMRVKINGEDLDEDRIYKLTADDYLQRGSGYPMLKAEDEKAEFHGWFIRDLVRNYLNDKEVYDTSGIRRIKK